MARSSKIPTSRIARSARIGRVAAGTTVRRWGTMAANVTRSDERSDAMLERRHVEAAEQIVAMLGTMKGAAMKLGQVLSFLDVGLVPEEYREEFQRKLAVLRDAAPDVSFDAMSSVIEKELGAPLGAVFSEFGEDAIGAASIGQVYRARLAEDGREVAVKVQYPGVADAVRADMANLGMILRLMKAVAPGLDARAIGREVRDRIEEELDYELEANNHRALARAFRGHPFIHVPDVVTRLCTERVIVTEYVAGRGFEEIKTLPSAERDRIGEIIFRFYMGNPYRLLMFSGDPHPGNALLMEDGRMAFIDFGLFKRLDPGVAAAEIEAFQAGHDGDAERLRARFAESGFIGSAEDWDAQPLLDQFLSATGWFLFDEEITLTPELATQVAIDMGDPRSEHFNRMRHQTIPADHLFGRRVELLTLAVLGQLGATANWFAIAQEWIYDGEPRTDLGRSEQPFYRGRAL